MTMDKGDKDMSTINTSYSSSTLVEQNQYKDKVATVSDSTKTPDAVSTSSVPQDTLEISKEAQDKIKADTTKTASTASAGKNAGAGATESSSSSSSIEATIAKLEKQVSELEKEIASLQKRADDETSVQLLQAKQAQLTTLQGQLLTLQAESSKTTSA